MRKIVDMKGSAMKRPARPRHKKKSDRLIHGNIERNEMMCDYALAPFDRRFREMDKKWGCDKLPELVSAETAAKWGSTMEKLNAAIIENDPAQVAARVEVALRGIDVMDREATERGAQSADDTIWIIEADGHEFGLLRDDRAWPTAKEKFPDLDIVTEREMVLALIEYKQSVVKEALDAAKKAFKNAEITAMRKTKEYEDKIPF